MNMCNSWEWCPFVLFGTCSFSFLLYISFIYSVLKKEALDRGANSLRSIQVFNNAELVRCYKDVVKQQLPLLVVKYFQNV